MRKAMKQMAEDSQKFMPIPEGTCISCGRRINRAALNLIWHYGEPGARPIQGGIAKPISQGSLTIIQFPVCDECAPPCRKCDLPIKTKAVREAAKKVSRQLGRRVSGFPGCRHTQLPGSSLLSKARRIFTSAPKNRKPGDGDSQPTPPALTLSEPPLSKLTQTIQNLIEYDRAVLATGKAPERRLTPHHAIKRDIALRAFQVDFERLSQRMQELNSDDFESKTIEIRRMDQHQLDALLDVLRSQRTDLPELEDYVRSRNSDYTIVDPIFGPEAAIQQYSEDSASRETSIELPMEEPAQDFIAAWSAAGRHLQSQTHDAAISWLKADLNPPFSEHLSFRLGNQLFFVRIEDVDGRLQTPSTLDSLRTIANGCNGQACLMPMKQQEGYWKPSTPGWGLVDARSGSSLDPYALVTEDKVEMTDWEVQDFAVQVVRNYVREKLGRQIVSSQGNPEVDPSIWFVGDNGPEWIVVRAARYPERDALLPENMHDIARNCSRVGMAGHFASVAVANSEQSESTMAKPLWRGHGIYVRFEGLQPLLGHGQDFSIGGTVHESAPPLDRGSG